MASLGEVVRLPVDQAKVLERMGVVEDDKIEQLRDIQRRIKEEQRNAKQNFINDNEIDIL